MSAGARRDVVVVGAGLAGLTAALALEAHGASVQVVEARARVGGRVQSMRHVGARFEAGGAYIGAGYRRVIGAAERHGVALVDVSPLLASFREQALVLDGEWIRPSEWPAHPRNPFPDRDKAVPPWSFARTLTARENPLSAPEEWLDPRCTPHDVPAHAWLQRLGLSDAAIALGYGTNASFGDDASGVSALSLFFRAAFSTSQRAAARRGAAGYTARDGMQRIPEAMAEALSREVHVCKVVDALTHDKAEAQAHCADGTVYRARHVVCALPFAVLRDVVLDPPLTGRQAEAVRELAAQPVTQLYFAHRSNFWERDGAPPGMFTDGPAGMVVAARSAEDAREVTSFTAWVTGRGARRLDALTEADAGRLVLDAIKAVRPAATNELEFVGMQAWGRAPCSRGGWAYFRPGQVTWFAADMGAAHGPIRFCGEHLARASRGMEGAMESGERAAREILAA